MNFLWKVLGVVALFTLVLVFAFRVPLPAWNLAMLGMCIANSMRVFLKDAVRSAGENEVDAEIYGREPNGKKAKKPGYHGL